MMKNSNQSTTRPVVLCILDGWGYRAETADNAIAAANTPTWDRLLREKPHALLETSGLSVGLPDGQMGNSEVGHMNLGAGRVVMQDLPRIDLAIADGSLAKNDILLKGIKEMKASGGTAHLLGLMSPGGVHSHQDHFVGLIRILDQHGVPVVVHALLDGRDTPPSSGRGYVDKFLKDIAGLKAKIATVSGRYYGMDRDKRWDRVTLSYQSIVSADAKRYGDALSAIDASYADGKTDEFMLPTVIGDYQGINDGDGLIMCNFRADRAREILTALVDPAFDGFPRKKLCSYSCLLGMTEYSEALNAFFSPLFSAESLSKILGEVVSDAGLQQLRIAETEKYAHVTFFLNGGREESFPGEERILVPSPKVATYDLAPEMSAFEVIDKLVDAVKSQKFGLIVANFANGDMVGHTGMLPAAVKAAETIDAVLSRLTKAIDEVGGNMLITADHGNLEMMRDPETGEPHTAHTIGKVPVILVGASSDKYGLRDGQLADVAPSLLALLGLPQPEEMRGHSLLI